MGRPTDAQRRATARAEQIRAERSRRDSGALNGQRQRLTVDRSKLDDGFTHRWVNDTDDRFREMTMRGWSIVADRAGELSADATGVGAEVRHRVGHGMTSVLMEKPLAIHIDDEAAKQRAIDETVNAMRAGGGPGGSADLSGAKLDISKG